jgi:hypothetical protein
LLHLSFHSPGRKPFVVGPAPYFRLARGLIFCGDIDSTVARYEKRFWVVDQFRYPRIECRQLLTLRFENHLGHAGPMIGPVASFKVLNRHVFAGRLNIARLQEDSLLWTHALTHDDWQAIRIAPIP